MRLKVTKKEIEKLFPINSIVKLIDSSDMHKMIIGQTAKVVNYVGIGEFYNYIIVEWLDPKFCNYTTGGWLPDRFELVGKDQSDATTNISFCPRCNGELIKKESEEPFTGRKYMIDKCKDCGWC
jgi:hypothetical protein